MPIYYQEAEMSVLGALMLGSKKAPKIAGMLDHNDFYLEPNQTIFKAIKADVLSGVDIDLVTATVSLKDSGKLESAGGVKYLDMIVRNTPSTANVMIYAKYVLEASQRRKIISVTEKIVSWCDEPDGKTPEQIIKNSIYLLSKIFGSNSKNVGH